MRLSFLVLSFLVALSATPLSADELIFTIGSDIGYGTATGLSPDADICLPPNCVLFNGTLTDTDTDGSWMYIGVPYTSAADGMTFDGKLSLDNLSPTGVLYGDPNTSVGDNVYSGIVFGVDIPVGTPAGNYTDTVNLDYFTVSADGSTVSGTSTVSTTVTVVVSPEPANCFLVIGGLAAIRVWHRVRCVWEPESSR